jgi:superfamily I DNA/RNA helicase
MIYLIALVAIVVAYCAPAIAVGIPVALAMAGATVARMTNRFAGACSSCRTRVAAGAGIAVLSGGTWSVLCAECARSGHAPAPVKATQPDPLAGVARLDPRRLSRYQHAILAHVARMRAGGALVVEAVAGSGKSATIVEAVCALVQAASDRAKMARSITVCAFNKHIRKEMAARLPFGVNCRTINSLGNTILSRYFKATKLVASKYRKIVRELVAAQLVTPDEVLSERERTSLRELVTAIVRVADMARLQTLHTVSVETVCELVRTYGYALPVVAALPEELQQGQIEARIADLASLALERGVDVARESGVIDYADQLWLPGRLDLYPAWQAGYVFVDEAQDLSPAQLDVVLRQRYVVEGRQIGRLIAVGDRHQAIYGFAGADCASLDRIVARAGAAELPLSVCYRCGTSHLEMAREIVSQIEERPDAIVGEVQTLDESGWIDAVSPESGDLVICRTNAPLIGLLWQLWSRGIRARMRGRDLSAELRRMVDSAVDDDGAVSVADVAASVERTAARSIAAVRATDPDLDDDDPRVVAIQDRADGLCGLIDAAAPATIDELLAAIERVAGSDDDEEMDSQTVWLSSIHRAKGDQARRVVVVNADRIALPSGIAWQAAQEQNLRYIAYTRAIESLVLVQSKPRRVAG